MSSQETLQAIIDGTAPAGLTITEFMNPSKLTSLTLPADSFFHELWINEIVDDIAWPDGLRCDYLWISNCPHLTSLPHNLTLHTLTIGNCPALQSLPTDLIITQHLDIRHCPQLATLPSVLHVATLEIMECPMLETLPTDTHVIGLCEVQNCVNLSELPANIAAISLDLSGCQNLRALPTGITAQFVKLDGCTRLERWDDPAITVLRQLDARGCVNLRQLPPNLKQIDELDLSNCTQLADVPASLTVLSWIDIGRTAIRALPQSQRPVALRWNGVHVTGRVAFHPETLTAAMVLAETNVETRRVMLEQLGMQRFIAEAAPTLRDEDRDPGGVRRLLAVAMPEGEEELLVLQVQDPSTGRLYLIRVPPVMQTCHQAAAWIAGFDDPGQYRPVAET